VRRSSGFGSWTDPLSSLYRRSFATFCIKVFIRISTATTHRCMVSVGLATPPGYRVMSSCVCDVASWMQSNCLQLNTSSRKSSGARRSADSTVTLATHEQHSLCTRDNKRPDGVTQVPWKRGRYLACVATRPDTFAQSYVQASSIQACSAETRQFLASTFPHSP